MCVCREVVTQFCVDITGSYGCLDRYSFGVTLFNPRSDISRNIFAFVLNIIKYLSAFYMKTVKWAGTVLFLIRGCYQNSSSTKFFVRSYLEVKLIIVSSCVVLV